MGLKRARVAAFVTVTTIAITLTLLNLFLILTLNVRKVVRGFQIPDLFRDFHRFDRSGGQHRGVAQGHSGSTGCGESRVYLQG
ncbi:MAG: hypothetical protein MZV64_02655 [Ignavibacteriales bacterium]|nr:hypothetical protein [Ignavibacteriales bacterium]